MAKKDDGLTPMMKQYMEFKAKKPDALLLFRCGDFYETYLEDAVVASRILGITLTRRSNGNTKGAATEMAGFPYHALDNYLAKLIRAGRRVAICEQLEDPKLTKKLVKRGITELVTPGVAMTDNVLSYKENNFLAAINFGRTSCGVAFLDISTGEFLVGEGSYSDVEKMLVNFSPKEVLFERGRREAFNRFFGAKFFTFELEDWVFVEQSARRILLDHFGVKSLKGFGIDHMGSGVTAAGAILKYLEMTNHTRLAHITALSRIDEERYVRLDRFTIRSLEIAAPMHEGGSSLLDVIDKTVSPMGARMLKRWLVFPLRDVERINRRQNVAQRLLEDVALRDKTDELIKSMGDLERIISRVAVGRVSPREMVQLKNALAAMQPLKEQLAASGCNELMLLAEKIKPCAELRERIGREIQDDPPQMVNKGGVIRSGVNTELDELRQIAYSGKDYLMKIQERETQLTGIASLKIGYNNVFGYYLEVRNIYKDKVPAEWVRKQTLTSAERYITQELKEYEEKILGAEDKILSLEARLFTQLVADACGCIADIQADAAIVARIDCLMSFAKAAEENNYARPEVDADSCVIDIRAGRHPVIERQLPPGESYVPNDIQLDDKRQQIMVITGPNMSGKSALLRQTALITLMAQIGSFVPAESARIGLVDKIFTRVGASDNISLGESTFMVEMTEAANILNNVTPRSLVLFDELGRGTSTYDGISIAWAILEYLHEKPRAQARTLFATHYHELNEMEKNFKRIKNFNVSVKEVDNKIIFMRRLERGGSEHSFGIHVAAIAGLPASIVKRAGVILKQLEDTNSQNGVTSKPSAEAIANSREGMQLSFFKLDDPVLCRVRDEIQGLDVNNLTPMEALNKLYEIQKIVGKKDA